MSVSKNKAAGTIELIWRRMGFQNRAQRPEFENETPITVGNEGEAKISVDAALCTCSTDQGKVMETLREGWDTIGRL